MYLIINSALMVGWLQPVHLPPWVSYYSESVVLIGLILGAIYGFLIGKTKKTAVPKRLIYVWAIVLFLLLLQFCLEKIFFFGDVVVYAIYLQLGLLAFLIGFNAEDIPKLVSEIQNIALFAGLVSVLLLLIQALGLDLMTEWVNPMPSYRRPGANLAQPNHAATLIIIATASLWAKYCSLKVSRLTFGLLMILFMLGLAVTESRAGFISCVAVFAWFALQANKSRIKSVAAELGVAFCAQQLLWWMWPTFFSMYWMLGGDGIANSFSAVSGNLRFLLWEQIWNSILNQPWLGWGWGQLPAALNSVATEYEISAPFTYSHNIIFDILVGFGLPLGIGLTGFLGWSALGAAFRVKDAVSVAAIGMMLPTLIHSMLEFPYAYAYFFVPILLLAGCVAQACNEIEVRIIPRSILAVQMLAIFVVGFYVAVEYVLIEEDFRSARFDSLRIGPRSKEKDWPKINVLTQLNAMVHATRNEPVEGMTKEAINELRHVAMRFPSIGLQRRYVLALALNGHDIDASRQLKVLRVVYGEYMYQAVLERWPLLGKYRDK